MRVFGTIAAMLELHATELRTGITLVEAVATDERLTELRMLGDVDELLKVAVTAAKLGITEADLQPMVRSWYLAQDRFKQLAYQVECYAAEFDGEDQA